MEFVPVTTTFSGCGENANAKRKLESTHSFFSLSVSSSSLGSSHSYQPFQSSSLPRLEPPPLTRCYSDGKISKAFGELLTTEEETDDQCVSNTKGGPTLSISMHKSRLQKNVSPKAGGSSRYNPLLGDGSWPLSVSRVPTSTFVTKTATLPPQRSADSHAMFTPPTPNKRVCCQQGFTQSEAGAAAWVPSLTQARKHSPGMSDEAHFASVSPPDKGVYLSVDMDLESQSSAVAEALSSCSSFSSLTPSIAVPRRGRLSAPKRTYPSQQRRSRNPGNLSLDLTQVDQTNFDPCNATEASKRHNDQVALCSKLTDFLYIGGAVAAKNKPLLIKKGITHVINCAASVAPASFPDDFCYFNIRLRDHSSQDIARHFYSIFDFIERARECGGRILLHCVKGISRSPTMAVAYLMWYKHIGMYGALDIVRQARPIVDPNAGFIFQLTEWEQQHPAGRLEFQRTIIFRLDMTYANQCSGSLSAKNPLFVPLTGIGESYFRDPTKDIGEQCLIVACANYMFVWCGTDVNGGQVEVAERGATILQRYEAFPVKCDTVRQGQEPVAFWDLVGDIL